MGAADAEVLLERPRDPNHGDVATNLALQLAKRLGQRPRDLAQDIVSRVNLPEVVVSAEVAGPGFINFRLAQAALGDLLHRIIDEGPRFGRSQRFAGKRVNVEFVSANPTGPLHVGHGRGAALGDAVASLLEATGHEVVREFYVNDAGVQIDLLARSLWARIQQAVGRSAEVPEAGYHGEYLRELADAVIEREGRELADLDESEALERCRELAVQHERAEQDRDLADFGVEFDVVFSERELYQGDYLRSTLSDLEKEGLTYEKDGALWLETSRFGDEKDRVLRKRDGTFTYFLPDLAYHRHKAARGFHQAIDVWGADHHGYIPRMSAGLRSLGHPEEFFRVVVVQLVKIVRQGAEVRFSKRAGNFVTLRELFEETGVDAARYFFLMRRGDSHFVFDIDLATKQSEENPVYYVQYAHTRMSGIFRTAGVDPSGLSSDGVDLTVLDEDDEKELIKELGEFPQVVERAARALEPHRVVAYLEDLARLVNGWYHRHRVVGSGPKLEPARMILARASQIVLANSLYLLGVSAPERM